MRLIFSSIILLFVHCLLFAHDGTIFDYRIQNFDQQNYEIATEALLTKFEKNRKIKITSGEKGTIVLRVYTYSGPGLCTSRNLVLALSKCLEARGFKKNNIFIVGDSERTLRDCGYLPPLGSTQQNEFFFHDMPVFWINDKQFYNENWVYKNPLTSREATWYNTPLLQDSFSKIDDWHKSYLPTILMFGADYWINLPVYIGHFQHGTIGSIIQGSIFNVSNNKRFLDNDANCAKIAPQIFATPELKNRCLFSITSLERFQYVDSLIYNENYVKSMPHILLSSDPVALDYFCTNIINHIKKIYGMKFLPTCPTIFKYAEQYDIGTTKYKIIHVKK